MRIIPMFGAAALICLCAASASLRAEQASIGKVKIELVAPEGYCALEASRTADQQVLSVVQTALGATNRLIGMSADCNQLEEIRQGKSKPLANYAQYQTLTTLMDGALPTAPASFIKQLCTMMRAEGEKMMGQLEAGIKSRMEFAAKNAKVNSVNLVGVVDEEEEVCYFAALISAVMANGVKNDQLSLGAVTVVDGKLVYYYLFQPYAKSDDVTAALKKQKVNVAAFRAKNKK